MNIGILVCIRKGKKYCGKSNITNKALYRINYILYTIIYNKLILN